MRANVRRAGRLARYLGLSPAIIFIFAVLAVAHPLVAQAAEHETPAQPEAPKVRHFARMWNRMALGTHRVLLQHRLSGGEKQALRYLRAVDKASELGRWSERLAHKHSEIFAKKINAHLGRELLGTTELGKNAKQLHGLDHAETLLRVLVTMKEDGRITRDADGAAVGIEHMSAVLRDTFDGNYATDLPPQTVTFLARLLEGGQMYKAPRDQSELASVNDLIGGVRRRIWNTHDGQMDVDFRRDLRTQLANLALLAWASDANESSSLGTEHQSWFNQRNSEFTDVDNLRESIRKAPGLTDDLLSTIIGGTEESPRTLRGLRDSLAENYLTGNVRRFARVVENPSADELSDFDTEAAAIAQARDLGPFVEGISNYYAERALGIHTLLNRGPFVSFKPIKTSKAKPEDESASADEDLNTQDEPPVATASSAPQAAPGWAREALIRTMNKYGISAQQVSDDKQPESAPGQGETAPTDTPATASQPNPKK